MTISKYLFSLFCNSQKIRMFATNFNYQDNYACESCVKSTAMKIYTCIKKQINLDKFKKHTQVLIHFILFLNCKMIVNWRFS